jgi:hypothetical protein
VEGVLSDARSTDGTRGMGTKSNDFVEARVAEQGFFKPREASRSVERVRRAIRSVSQCLSFGELRIPAEKPVRMCGGDCRLTSSLGGCERGKNPVLVIISCDGNAKESK